MAAAFDGPRLGRILAFLTSALQPLTQQRYASAVHQFQEEMLARGLDFLTIPEEEADWLVAEHVVDMFEVSDGAEGLSAAAVLVAALAKSFPRRSWKI